VLFSVPGLRNLIGSVPVGNDGFLRASIAVLAFLAVSSLWPRTSSSTKQT
jgi:hypothetical protein